MRPPPSPGRNCWPPRTELTPSGCPRRARATPRRQGGNAPLLERRRPLAERVSALKRAVRTLR
eukprot:1259802-Lingulodinium_polyedra.AAC.1